MVKQHFDMELGYHGTVHVVYSRFPNANGTIVSVKKWSHKIEDDEYDEEPRLMSLINHLSDDERNQIDVRAAKLWDEYWTVDDVKCADSWLKWHQRPKNCEKIK